MLGQGKNYLPPNLGFVPPNILVIGAKRAFYVVLKIRQNVFWSGYCPGLAGGAHDAPPDHHVGWEDDISPHTLPYSAPRLCRLRRLGFRGDSHKYFPLEPRLRCCR